MGSNGSTTGGSQLDGACLALSIPAEEKSLLRHSASAPVLNFLAENPEFDLSVRQLSRLTCDRLSGYTA